MMSKLTGHFKKAAVLCLRALLHSSSDVQVRGPCGLSSGAVHLATQESGRYQTAQARRSAQGALSLCLCSGGPGKQRGSDHSHCRAYELKVEMRHLFVYFNNIMLKPEVGTHPREGLNGLLTAKSFLFLVALPNPHLLQTGKRSPQRRASWCRERMSRGNHPSQRTMSAC